MKKTFVTAAALSLLIVALAACSKTPPAAATASTETPAAAAANPNDKELPPAPSPARSVAIPKPVEKTLDNGLRVIVVQHGGTPLVTAELNLLSGSEVDPPSLSGLAGFTANLLTQGTKTRSAPQIAQASEALGASLTAAADWDASRIGITVTTPKTSEALDLLADVVRNPTFAKAEVERQRSQALDGLSVQLQQPRSLASLVATRLLFGTSPYGHSRLGTPASLKQIHSADLVKLHETYYRPDNAVLVFSGDIDGDTAFALAEKVFGSWAKPNYPVPPRPTIDEAPAAAGAVRVVAIDLPGAGQAAVVAVHRLPPRKADDYYAGVITNAVLGGGYSARLNSEIRIKRGLSYGAGSRFQALRDAGVLLAFAQTKNQSAPEVADLIRAEITKLSTEPVPLPELTARKASLIGGFSRGLQTTSGIAEQLGELITQGIDLDAINHTIANAEAVTPAQVQAYAAAHLDVNDVDIVIVGDAKQFSEALGKAYPDLQLIPAASLDLDDALPAATPAPAAARAP
jgi:zinc protease